MEETEPENSDGLSGEFSGGVCGEPSRAERGGVAEEARMNCNDNCVGEMSALLHSVWKRRGGGVFCRVVEFFLWGKASADMLLHWVLKLVGV